MDQFLETYNLSRLSYEKIENMNRLRITKEIKAVIKNLPTKRSPPGQTASQVNNIMNLNNN